MFFTIIVFFIILSILVFVHEFGHFIAAIKLGIGVEEFGFGIPPRAWATKIRGIEVSLNWLPIGGFVRLKGEDLDESQKSEVKSQKELQTYFWARSKLDRTIVLLAGVTMNFLLAVIIITYIFTQGVLTPTDAATGKVFITAVSAKSPASSAGLREEDRLISFAGVKIESTSQIITLAKDHGGENVTLVIEREGVRQSLQITPRKDVPKDQGPLGIGISDHLERVIYPWYQAPFYGTLQALRITWFMLTSLGTMVWKLITFQPTAVDVSGPVGIARETGRAIQYGLKAVLQLTGIISLNLALFNVLPIPALDGGRLFFVLFEDIIGKKVKPAMEAAIHQAGLVFLLAVAALITVHDILKIVRGG